MINYFSIRCWKLQWNKLLKLFLKILEKNKPMGKLSFSKIIHYNFWVVKKLQAKLTKKYMLKWKILNHKEEICKNNKI